MTSSQKIVAIGAGSGVVGMATLVYVLYHILPNITGVDTLLDRLVFTLQMNLFAVMPFFIMVAVVGNGRFLSEAIDPTKHLENKSIEINGRVANNTLEQNFVFLVGTLALSTFLNTGSIKVIEALTIVFVCARILFWIGYRMNPLYRAPGMSATAYMNLGILVTTMYFFFVR
jgi:hypothetical protein